MDPSMLSDFRLALRSLRRSPSFSLIVITSLGFGIALAAAAFATANAYLLRSLPYAGAGRLYHVMYAPPGPVEPRGVSGVDWASLQSVVEAAVTAQGETDYFEGEGFAEPARALRVSPGFIAGLDVQTVVGRRFDSADYSSGTGDIALIGHRVWRERFGGESSIIGRRLRVESEGDTLPAKTLTIVGVLAPGFWFGRDSRDPVDLLLPLREPAHTYMVKLRSGVAPADAERRITEAVRQAATWIPPDWSGVHLESARDRYVAGLGPVLVAVTVAASLVLLIALANVAVLVLLRALRRQRDLAVRVALGARSVQLARPLVAESLLLSTAAMLLGVTLSALVLRIMGPGIESQLRRPAPGGVGSITMDPSVLLAVLAVGILITLSLAFLPLLTPWSRALGNTLRGDARGGTDGVSLRRMRAALIALELAGSLVLLSGTALMVRRAWKLLHADLGINPEHVLRGRVVLPGRFYPDSLALHAFFEEMQRRVASVVGGPVAFANWPPFIETPLQSVASEGQTISSVGRISVGADFFAALQIPVMEGRVFTPADRLGSEPVAVVSSTLARRLWPAGSALGRHLAVLEPQTGPDAPPAVLRRVVGVVADVRQTYADSNQLDVYLPYFQASLYRFGSFYLRTERPAFFWAERLRTTVAELDSRAMLASVVPMASENRDLGTTRFLTTVASAFAILAGFLTALGIYGVTAYSIRQREREIAIRLALGAPVSRIVGMFLREGAGILLLGLGAGTIGVGGLGRILRHRVPGVGAMDLTGLIIAGALLLVAGALAILWPAWQSARKAPLTSLNQV